MDMKKIRAFVAEELLKEVARRRSLTRQWLSLTEIYGDGDGAMWRRMRHHTRVGALCLFVGSLFEQQPPPRVRRSPFRLNADGGLALGLDYDFTTDADDDEADDDAVDAQPLALLSANATAPEDMIGPGAPRIGDEVEIDDMEHVREVHSYRSPLRRSKVIDMQQQPDATWYKLDVNCWNSWCPEDHLRIIRRAPQA